MPRTTSDLVEELVDWDTSSTPSLTPFITAANMLVTDICEPAGLSEASMTVVETWLAAHFYHIKDRRVSGESAGPVSQSFRDPLEKGLDATTFGQQAKALDTTGALAAWDKRQKDGKRKATGVTWLGTPIEVSSIP